MVIFMKIQVWLQRHILSEGQVERLRIILKSLLYGTTSSNIVSHPEIIK